MVILLLIIAIFIVLYLVTRKKPKPPIPTKGPAPLPNGVHLTLINQTSVSSADVEAYLKAQQDQIDKDFSPKWGGSAVIDQNPGGWPVYLQDVSDVPDALGYHDVDASGPYAKVFVQTAADNGTAWQVVASHEVLETLADSNANTTDVGPDGCDWYQEVGDPVEDKTYQLQGVPLSDFALPSWFTVGGVGPFDFLGILSAPFTVTSGGYAESVCNGKVVTHAGKDHKPEFSVDRGY